MNVLPRYKKSSVGQYSTTEHIMQNQPELISDSLAQDRLIIKARNAQLELTNKLNNNNSEQPSHATPTKSDFSLFSPNVSLLGHSDEVLAVQFSNDGRRLISGGMDNSIFMWNLEDHCKNTAVFGPAKLPITDIRFSQDDQNIYGSSADGSISYYNTHSSKKVRKLMADVKVINSIDVSKKGTECVISASNSGTVKIFDVREKEAVKTFPNQYPVLAVCFGFDYTTFCTGGIDNIIRVWDTRLEKPVRELEGHSDSITSLSISHEGSFLLSNSMDNSMKVWDLKTNSASKVHLKSYTGHMHGLEKNLIRGGFNYNGHLVSCGSSDGKVRIWDSNRRTVLLTLGGHEGCANQVIFSPNNDIVASCSADKTIILTELPVSY